ncbi:related to fungal transcriptional regulatory protein [Cephalotrichum gorgonifer]|uniref:Related to fungal transcriptional regulatory protein n=1 Tax=Cephalotrichum gorgonifer TaxID=2041049 RepID=A0AAE8MQP8_9PEZI|nr:related to fungal transcriptional regulatory protein [Cephalotrichum gorgonifer]
MATATTAKPNLTYFLNNPCHNCRRRRLRCDRSRPSCNKCSSLGRECLGYDKLFVWTQVCRDLAAHDGPDCNPFRELIPLSLAHPFLLHIIIATSAMHMSNISHPPITTQPPLLPDPADHLQCLRATDGISRRAFLDSLVAKDRAIQHLRYVLKDPKGVDRGVLLAAMLFFVNFELIDLGRGGWKDHLHGACRILDLLRPEVSPVKLDSRTALHDCIVSDFVIYHILGSTLVSAGLAASIAKHALNLSPLMERVEATSYLCCPATILQLILSASRLSGDATGPEIPHSVTMSALDIIHHAMAFDIRAWAVSIQPRIKVPDLASRTAVAMAHRAALCLYILQAVPSTRPHAPVSVDALVRVILNHLSEVDEGDVHFKATSWPTFIAGAEARDYDTRVWVLSRLMRMWECCPWGYVFAAVEMLRRTWRMRDDGSVGEAGWLQELWAMDMGFLIV